MCIRPRRMAKMPGHCAACRRPGRRRRGISQPSGGDVGVDISGGSYTGFSGSTKYSGLRRHAVRRRLSAEPSRRADYRQQHRRGDYRQRPHCRVQLLQSAIVDQCRFPMPASTASAIRLCTASSIGSSLPADSAASRASQRSFRSHTLKPARTRTPMMASGRCRATGRT